jgi:hypothetical protein
MFMLINTDISVTCRDKNLFQIPNTNISTSVELLDMSYNALNALENSSFGKYPNVKTLYLVYAPIYNMEANTSQGLHFLKKYEYGIYVARSVLFSVT